MNGSGEAEPPQSLDFSGRAVGEAFNPDVQPVVLNSALSLGVGPLPREREPSFASRSASSAPTPR